MKSITDYDIYKLAEKLADMIWYAYDDWPLKVQRTTGYQIIDSADSISANLTEGYGRYHGKDKKKFYYYSRGSFEETKNWLRKLYRRKIISHTDMMKYKIIVDELGPKLNNFIKGTK